MGSVPTTCRGTHVSDTYEVVDHTTGVHSQAPLASMALHSTPKSARVERVTFPEVQSCLSTSVLCFAGLAAGSLASAVVSRARNMLSDVVLDSEVLTDHEWYGPGGDDPLHILLGARTTAQMGNGVIELAREARLYLESDDTLVDLEAPVHVFGDIHGQFRDLLLFFADFGFPDASGTSYIFNGDFVDRGAHQIEVVVLLFALKVVYPTKIVLLRGNHEDQMQNHHMGDLGFERVCARRFGPDLGTRVFCAVHLSFQWLPLASCISQRILVLHGGIGAGDWDLSYVRHVKRPLSHECLSKDLLLYNMLWSDPIPEDEKGCGGVHDSPRDDHRHLIAMFGPDVTEEFCKRNRLDAVVRSHQIGLGGCGFEIMHSGRCIVVFSARDYEGHMNDASILHVVKSPTGELIIKPEVQKSILRRRVDSCR